MMQLFYETGTSAVDEPLVSTIQRYERVFSGRVRGYYLLGSYADRCPVVGSDIDMYILFREAFVAPEEIVRAQELAHVCAQMSTLRLEIKLCCEQELAEGNEQSIMRVALKQNSVLLYGSDTRPTMELPTRETYTRDATDAVLDFLFRLHHQDYLTYPLTYPQAGNEFYGYEHLVKLPAHVASIHASPEDADNTYYATRELVECACRMATALLALQTDCYVGAKRESVGSYQKMIGGEWSPFLLEMFEKGKLQWGYGLPKGSAQRTELRVLCGQMLPFENHYLRHYRAYLLRQARSAESTSRQFAFERFAIVHYDDDEVYAVLMSQR
ncbi:hypothetical protein [Ktedonobacter sp. SOSP1-85]|uniref:hypothetical protein n=1 Tax=Ktedonobacter sp. SOSP1-85 TaxID=2778367 RepID=UPI001915466E|nr:hypothetical protein [Ktedonobacter sp. SOSP1-85]